MDIVKILVALLLLALIGCTPKDCMTERELLADVAAGFLAAQGFSAQACDALLGSRVVSAPLARLHREIAGKFRSHWEDMASDREGRYRRMYEAAWREQMDTDNAEMARRNMTNLRVSATICSNLKTEMEIRLASEWSYIKAKLNYAARQAMQTVKVCK